MDWFDKLKADNNPRIDKTTKIWHPERCNIYGNCIIEAGCKVGDFVEIGPGVRIGAGTSIAAFCFIPEGVTIGEGCFIGPRVTFTNDKYPPGGKEAWEKITVENHVSIGAGAIVLPGVTIGKGAMVGAGSIVTGSVPEGMVVAGNPARIIKPRFGRRL